MEVSWSSHFKKWNQHLPYLSAFFVDFLFSLLSIPNSSKSVKVETWIINPRNISKFADFGERARHNSQKKSIIFSDLYDQRTKRITPTKLRVILRKHHNLFILLISCPSCYVFIAYSLKLFPLSETWRDILVGIGAKETETVTAGPGTISIRRKKGSQEKIHEMPAREGHGVLVLDWVK